MNKFPKIIKKIMVMTLILMLPITNTCTYVFASVDATKDIVDIAVADGRFKTLVEALKAADLVNTLKEKGEYTVFAPTDEAFAKLPKGTLETLLKPESKDTLKDILLYHVAKDDIDSGDLIKLNGKEIPLANGKKAKVTVKNGEIFINDAKIIIKDIEASNGVIHVIDAVLQAK